PWALVEFPDRSSRPVSIIGNHLYDVVSFLFIDGYPAQFYLIDAGFGGGLPRQINQLVFEDMLVCPLRKLLFADGFIDSVGLNAGDKMVLILDARGKQPKIKIAAVVYHNRVFGIPEVIRAPAVADLGGG